MLFTLYALLGYILWPFIQLFILIHHKILKKDSLPDLLQRMGYPSIPRTPGKWIWFHGASVGECNAIVPLIKKIKAETDYNILVTSITQTSKTLLDKKVGNLITHQFCVYDINPWVNRFLKHWRPDAVFFIESELWPLMLKKVSDKKIPLYLLNARLSDKSFKRWKKVPGIIRALLNLFTSITAQSPIDKRRFQKLSNTPVIMGGNLKFLCNHTLLKDQDTLTSLKKVIGKRPFWIYASTHAGEESIAFKIHKKLKKQKNDILTIIIPRHPERMPKIEKAIPPQLTYASHSKGPRTLKDQDIYFVDTIGDLPLFYDLKNIVVMGGSFVKIGGHNPIEPAFHENVVLRGPHFYNFKSVSQVLGPYCESVKTQRELNEKILFYLNNPKICKKKGKDAKQKVQEQETIIQETMENILRALPQESPS